MERASIASRVGLPAALAALALGVGGCGLPAPDASRPAPATASSSEAHPDLVRLSQSAAPSASRSHPPTGGPSGATASESADPDSMYARGREVFGQVLGDSDAVLPPSAITEGAERYRTARPARTDPAECAPMTNMAAAEISSTMQDAVVAQSSDDGGTRVLSAVRFADAETAAEVFDRVEEVMGLCRGFRSDDYNGAAGEWEYRLRPVRVDGRRALDLHMRAVPDDGMNPVESTTLYVLEDDVIGEVTLLGAPAVESTAQGHVDRDADATTIMDAFAD